MSDSIFTKYFEICPDKEGYLKRINFRGEIKLDSDCLNELIIAHQLSVPFENVDVHRYHLPVVLDIDHLYEKIVMNHRGGYCFENNTSFCSLLRALGFNARPCMCRIVHDPSDISPIRHRATIVTIDDCDYFVDVGFGGAMSAKALPIKEGIVTKACRESFSMKNIEDSWWMVEVESPYLQTDSGVTEIKTKNTIMFSTHHCIPNDFEPYNTFCFAPESIFYQAYNLYIRRSGGFAKLVGNKLSIIDGETVTKKELSESEIPKALRDIFGIEVSKEYIEKMKMLTSKS